MDNDKFDMERVNNFFENDYQDRGILKWQGFFLSDHTAELKREAIRTAKEYPLKSQQSLTEIGKILSTAFKQHKMVLIQLNILDINSERINDKFAYVLGYSEESVVITNNEFIDINHIRHIDIK